MIIVLFFSQAIFVLLYYISLTKYYYELYYKGWINLPSLHTKLA